MNATILVVEDEQHLRQLYQMELEAEGYRVYTAANAEEALNCLHEKTIDLLVMDLMFPEGSGVNYLNDFMQINRNLKVVINTAYPTFKFDFQTWAADAFLTKSSDISQLKSTIACVLKTKKRSRKNKN